MFTLPDALSILTTNPHWVVWKLENVAGRDKPAKVPYNPNTERRASPNDCKTWATFSDASKLADKIHGGIGFMFKDGCGYAGIDLDNVILPDGTLKPYAQEIVDFMNSYTEVSPSGHGLHILFMLKRPLSEFGTRRRKNELGLEIYDTERYFTVTGNVYGDEKPIKDCTHNIGEIYNRYWQEKTEATSNTPPVDNSESFDSWKNQPETDSELLARMFDSQHGHEIKRLYDGDTSGYNSQSEADLALCNHFAFWTRRDFARIDSLFRTSGLMRPKWDEKHGKQTYGEITIEKAIKTASERFQIYSQDKTLGHDKNSRTKGNFSLSEQLENSIDIQTQDFYLDHMFSNEIQSFQSYSHCVTGYNNLDNAGVRVYPGLYAVGGISSVGKTTFCTQLADNLAQRGQYVVYFSLEQSRLELTAKSIARLVMKNTHADYVSATRIKNGFTNQDVQNALNEYRSFAQNISFVEGIFALNIDNIIDTVEQFCEKNQQKPVVFVDYLQAIAQQENSHGVKDNIDLAVRNLKTLSVKLNIPVFVISSFNRSNYLSVADFESFKESGNIEYTSDVVIALQLAAMNAHIFNSNGDLQIKRKFVQQAKSQSPRKIELLTLKNRFGNPYSRYFFDYYPAADYFAPFNLCSDSDSEIADFDDEIIRQAEKFKTEYLSNGNADNSKRHSF